MKDETDEALLYYIAQKDEDPALAREAMAEFWTRYHPFVSKALARRVRCGKGYLGHEDIEDATIDTFRKVLEHGAASFQMGDCPLEKWQSLVRSWLMQIASNAIWDIGRQSKIGEHRIKPVSDEAWSAIEITLSDSLVVADGIHSESLPVIQSPRISVMTSLLAELSPTDREAVLIWLGKFDAETRTRTRLKSSELEEICEKLGTTPDALRQRQRRALKFLKEQFIARMSQHECQNAKTSA